MNKYTFNHLRKAVLFVMLCVSGCLVTSCLDDVAEENRFTWTGELISDHLENHPEKYSKFVTILKKANISKKAKSSIFKTLSTYGSYTCFAPTNDAIDAFLEEMIANPESGITSTDIELIDDSIATEIAKNHIIEKGYKTIDVSKGNFPKRTMNQRPINMTDTILNGETVILLDKVSRIVELDTETENGIIQTINKVLNPSTKKIHEQILQHPELSLFGQAVIETGFDSILSIYEYDPHYEGNLEANKYVEAEGKAYSPKEHRQRYTVLIETNELLANPDKNHKGMSIQTIEDLEKFAQEFYGTEAPGDYKNPKNALYQYIAYHIIDRELAYEGGYGGFIMENYTNSNGDFKSEVNLTTIHDRYDYFETMLPYTLIKVTRPFHENTKAEFKNELILNYAQDHGNYTLDSKMEKYINVFVLEYSKSGVKNFDQKALNGQIHTINKILVYNETEMAGNVLNERMRWDVSSLFPEWTNNGVRWEDNTGEDNSTTYIPDGYSKRLVVNGVVDNTVILYLRPHSTSTGGYPNYQGDELLALGRYDFKYRIPHVPEGNYEIRFGYSVSNLRAITQFYYDDKVCGIPVDMNLASTDPLVGWFDETAMETNEILENDKAMRNRGYMKGPASCFLDNEGHSMRHSVYPLRKILGQFNITRGEDHWLRFKNVTENEKHPSYGQWVQFNQDFLEIVPTNIINGSKPEDQY